MHYFSLEKLASESECKNQAWLEFLRTPSLSMGLYRLMAGQTDRQRPHTEDEVYYVLSGKAWFRAGGEEQPVGAGSLMYVERLVEHCFFDISEDLTVLVFFAPGEGSLKQPLDA